MAENVALVTGTNKVSEANSQIAVTDDNKKKSGIKILMKKKSVIVS
jgi:hypothetical protein